MIVNYELLQTKGASEATHELVQSILVRLVVKVTSHRELPKTVGLLTELLLEFGSIRQTNEFARGRESSKEGRTPAFLIWQQIPLIDVESHSRPVRARSASSEGYA